MHRFLIGFATICAACSPPARVETRLVAPEVPAPLRQICAVAAAPATTLADVARLLTDHVAALDCANGRITAIDTILTAFETDMSEDLK